MSVPWPVVVVGAVVVGAGLGALHGAPPPAPPASPTAAPALPAPQQPAAVTPPPPAPPPPATAAPEQDVAVLRTLPPSQTPTVALTFDDGPHPVWTPAVLDVLARHDVTATFCVVGSEVAGREALLARVVAEGHVLCNHTESHDYALPVRSPETIRADLQAATARIEAAGAEVSVFRAPGGRFEPSVLAAAQAEGLTSWAWSVDPADWRTSDPQAIVSAVLEGVEPGAVVVLHDGGGDRSATVTALATLVPLLRSVGYEFVGLPR